MRPAAAAATGRPAAAAATADRRLAAAAMVDARRPRGAFDLELLLNELLAVSAPTRDPVEPLRSSRHLAARATPWAAGR